VEVAKSRRGRAESPPSDIISKITTICAHVVLSARQMREAAPHFRRAGFLRPQLEVAYFRELEAMGKLSMLPESGTRKLRSSERRPFRSGSVRDDVHLYEAAAACGKVVVTEDTNLLEHAEDIRAALGVATISPDDA